SAPMTTRSAHRSRTVALLALLGIAALVITIGIVLGLTGQAEHPAPGTSPTPGAGASDGGDGSDGGGSEPPPASDPDPSPPPDEAERTAQCPEPTTTVEDTAGLHSALEQARPGDVIRPAPGTDAGAARRRDPSGAGHLRGRVRRPGRGQRGVPHHPVRRRGRGARRR